MKKVGFIAGVSFLAGAIFFALTFGFIQNSGGEKVVMPASVHAETINYSPGTNFAPLVKKVRPAVVKVMSESIRQRRSVFGDPFFDRFFNSPSRQEKVSGVGSGFLISGDGYIITNNHVVKDAIKVTIMTIDGKKYTAKIIGTDSKTDLALLKIKGKNHPYIELGDSKSAQVGEWVLAIGNPFNQDLTVTAGIISAKGRRTIGATDYEDYIQTDAAINRGNSGGPLINMKGKVIGINSVIIAPSGGNVGIGFAIPSAMAKKVIGDIKTQGRVVRGWLGIVIREMDKDEAKEFDYPMAGLLISQVEEGSPARKAGLKRNDFIIKLNNKRIKSGSDLRLQIANLNPGDNVKLSIYRGEKLLNINVKIGEAPDTMKFRSSGNSGRTFDLGMVLVENSRSLARELELRTTNGLVVQKSTGVARKNGIKAFDVILGVNRTDITSVDQFRSIISRKEPGSFVFLYVNRFGQEFYLKFILPE